MSMMTSHILKLQKSKYKNPNTSRKKQSFFLKTSKFDCTPNRTDNFGPALGLLRSQFFLRFQLY